MNKHRRRQKQGYNHHHLIPRSRGGQDIDSNMLFIKMKKHNALHRMFSNYTPSQLIKTLQHFEEDMLTVFGTTDFIHAAKMIERLMKFKERNWYEED